MAIAGIESVRGGSWADQADDLTSYYRFGQEARITQDKLNWFSGCEKT